MLEFVNFDLGVYLLQNDIEGLKIEEVKKMTTVGQGDGQALS